MAGRRVNQIASAIVKKMGRGRRGPPGRAALGGTVASAVGPPRGGGLAAAVASVVASRIQTKAPRGRPGGASQLDILASKLASAMTRRLASPGATSGPTLDPKKLTGGIASRVTRRLGSIQTAESAQVGTLDPQATAEAVIKIIAARQASADPMREVASRVAARLHRVAVAGRPNEARDFQSRVASIVVERLRTEQQAQTAEALGADAAAGESKEVAGAAATAESDSGASGGGETATAAARKRG